MRYLYLVIAFLTQCFVVIVFFDAFNLTMLSILYFSIVMLGVFCFTRNTKPLKDAGWGILFGSLIVATLCVVIIIGWSSFLVHGNSQ